MPPIIRFFHSLERAVLDLISDFFTRVRAVDPGVAGGWLLFADMILCAALFMFWEKAGQIGRAPSKR